MIKYEEAVKDNEIYKEQLEDDVKKVLC